MSNPTVYWDSCLFFAWVKDEKRTDAAEMAGLYSVASEIDAGTVNLVTSAITRTELNMLSWPKDQQDKLNGFLNRSNVDVVPLAPHMGDIAGQLREYYKNQPGPNLCRDDAYHLAAAIALNVWVFQTFDERDKKGCRGLIPLSGSVANYPLQIAKPVSQHGQEALAL